MCSSILVVADERLPKHTPALSVLIFVISMPELMMASLVDFAKNDVNLDEACYIFSFVLELSICYSRTIAPNLNYSSFGSGG